MKKNSSMQGTLNKLFGKKNANNNSLYAENPPWILPQGTKKASVGYQEGVHNSFAFLDDSGTATLKSRPGPRVRPMLHFSTSNTETQGLAVPTPSVPKGFADNASLGNGSTLNGNYRMYSSVGDLRLINYDDYHEEIPAPPNMPPPPPPTMAPPPPPQKSPPSSAISSPSSPSPPDFIPPTPNSSAPVPPSFLPTDQSSVSTTEPHSTNVAKWKSETGLHAVLKDLPMSLPNRFSLNPAAFQHNQGQTNLDGEPQSTLPKSFKIPPPAPTRISSIQLQEPQNLSYTKDPPPSPVPSTFNPSFQARLFTSNRGQQSLNDTLNKRKSMLIMEDLPDLLDNCDQRIEKSVNMMDTVGSRTSSLKDNTDILHNPHVKLNKEIKNDDAINDNKTESATMFKENQPAQSYKFNNSISELVSVVPAKGEEGQKYSQHVNELNTLTLTKHGYTQEIHKTSKPTVKIFSLKPRSDLSNANGSQRNSPTRKEMNIFPQELTKIDYEVKTKPERRNVVEQLLTPPSMAPPPPPMAPPPPPMAPPPPPPPMTVPPSQKSITPLLLPLQNSTPPKRSPIINSTAPPPAVPLDLAPVARMPSPLLSPKLKNNSVTPKPPSLVPPPPPAPPPLPSSLGLSNSVPLQEALQAKQQTLKKIPKTIEIRPAQTSSIPSVNDEQKIRVGKIKGELEALFSPKKDEKGEQLRNSRLGLEQNKNSSGNFSQSKGGENTLVNSLMLKVPLLPAKFEREDVDADNSEWLPKSNKIDIQIPEPDYLPASPINRTEKSAYSDSQSKIPTATLEISVPSLPVTSTQKDTDMLKSSVPTYKPHRDIKLSTESSTLNELPVVISKLDTDVSLNLESVPQHTEMANLGPPVKQELFTSQAESSNKQPVSGGQVETNSPMALLMAAQKRAQKANSVERRNLPKVSVTNGLFRSLSASPANERKANTFVIVPNKEHVGQFTEEEVTSFTSNSVCHLDSSIPSIWRGGELQSSDINNTLGRRSENSSDKFSVPHVHNSYDLLFSSTDAREDYLKPKSSFDNHASYIVPSSTGSPSFNISSFPSPIPFQKMDNEIEYGIIPPPAEFMNSPVGSNSNFPRMGQEDRSYNSDHSKSFQSDLLPNYDRYNSINQPFVSLSTTTSSGFNNYSSDSYSSALNRDSQRSSLIKKRLYMPEPESSRNYGLSARSSAMPMSYMHAQSSSNMVPDPRRSNTTSRFLPHGRRISSENISRMGPPVTDMKYKSPNSDNLVGKSSTRSQGTCQQGMTFTVRPGTRQPISQTYQGGYL